MAAPSVAPGRPVTLPIMLAALCLGTFLMTSSGISRASFLLDMARDLETTLAAVANLVSLSAVAWGITSLVAGVLSDRIGRQLILVGAVGLLALSLVVIALAPVFLMAAVGAVLGGLSGGAYAGTVFATVADHVAPERRGRALGWVMTGQSLALVLGVPLATLIGVVGGWRGTSGAQALAAGLLALVVWLTVPGGPGPAQTSSTSSVAAPRLRDVLTGPILTLLSVGIAERICYAGMVVYLATYLIASYGVALQELALALGLVALGNLVGNTLGSQLADRLPRPVLLVGATSVVTGLLALPLFLWQPGITGSIALGFLYALVNALGRPALLANLSLVPAGVRGSVLGLNVTAASVGWLSAAAVGGWLIGERGFASLGYAGALVGSLGAVLALASWWVTRAPLTAVVSGPAIVSHKE